MYDRPVDGEAIAATVDSPPVHAVILVIAMPGAGKIWMVVVITQLHDEPE